MNHCKHFHFDGVMHTPCPQCEIDHLRAEIERLKADLAEVKKDAELFVFLQNLPQLETQAFFWNYQSRTQRRKAILEAMKSATINFTISPP